MNLNSVPTRNPVHYRTYSRNTDNGKETLEQALDRSLTGIQKLGKLTEEQTQLIKEVFETNQVLPSGRWLWISNTEWIENPDNYSGAYNCEGIRLEDWSDFELNFDDLHKGCGVGTTITEEEINSLPSIVNVIDLVVASVPGEYWSEDIKTEEYYKYGKDRVFIEVADNRQSWSKAYRSLLEISSNTELERNVKVVIDFGYIRPSGTPIKGFGGVANPDKLAEGFQQVVNVLNKAAKDKRQLNVLEICLLLNIAGYIAVSGNIRRSARINQADKDNELFTTSKDNLWKQDSEGNWIVDKEKDVLRYSNHTRLFFKKPTKEEVKEAVTKQYYSSEGAIMYVPNALIRTNIDLLNTEEKQKEFKEKFEGSKYYAKAYLVHLLQDKYRAENKDIYTDEFTEELEHRFNRINFNPCLTGDMLLLTKQGYLPLQELEGKEVELINYLGEISKGKVWLTGEKQVYQIRLSNNQIIKCTEDHKFMLNSGEEELAINLKNHQLMPYLNHQCNYNLFDILGFIQGDGTLSRLKSESHLGIEVNVGYKDEEIKQLIKSKFRCTDKSYRAIYLQDDSVINKLKKLKFSTETLPTREFPETYSTWNFQEKRSFLKGCYSANGSVIRSGRITYKSTCKKFIEQLQYTLLEDFGISSYVTTNKAKEVEFSNGIYLCKESYDLNISQFIEKVKFFNTINFIQNYKVIKLRNSLITTAPYVTSIKKLGIEYVYDFSEPLTNWGVIEGFVTHNCGEILG